MEKFARSVSKILPSSLKRIAKKVTNFAISAVPGDVDIEILGLKHGTDKLCHGYLPHYDAHFSPLKRKKLNILEIGVGGFDNPKDGGASLRLWQDYFANSYIYGLDIHDKSFHNDDRIKTFQGSQNDPSFLKRMALEIGMIDIVIDDGSHISEHINTSFKTLFPHLNTNGIYVIEDINTSYLPACGGSFTDLLSEHSAIGMVKSLIDSLNYEYIPGRTPMPFDGQIVSLHCYPKIIFIKKGKNKYILSTHEIAMIKDALDESL